MRQEKFGKKVTDFLRGKKFRFQIKIISEFFPVKKKFLIFFREKLSDPFPNARKKFISLYGFEGMFIKIVLFFKCLINQKIYRISLFLATIFFILFYKTR